MKSTSLPSFSAAKSAGFTLLELMITLVVAAVLIGIAAPNMRSFILNNRLTSTADELIRSLQTARTEATKLQQNVVVCLSSDATTCTTTGYNGWIVFEDTNGDWARQTSEPLIETHTFDTANSKLFADNDKLVSYSANGFRTLNGTKTNATAMVVCDSRGYLDINGGTTGQSLARGIIISTTTGRVRMTRLVTSTATDNNGVKELLIATGGSCS